MTTKRDFYWDIRKAASEAIEDINKLDEQAQAITDKINSKRYTVQAISTELKPELEKIRRQKEERREQGFSTICTKTAEYVKELHKANQLNPDDITDDIKLLQAGVALSADDLTALFDRNTGNNTMQKLISDFAKQHNRDIQRCYRPANIDFIRGVESIPETMKVVLKWNDKPNVFNQFIGEGSNLDLYLRD